MNLTDQDKKRLRHLANLCIAAADGEELRTIVGGVPFDGPETIEELLTSIKVGADIQIVSSEPLPGPNPGGVTARELGDGMELVDPNSNQVLETCDWFNPVKRQWFRGSISLVSKDVFSWRRPKKQEQHPPTNEEWSQHPAVQASATEALRQEMQPTPPNPGPRHRLVDTKTEQPREDAEVWNAASSSWIPRAWHYNPYQHGAFYRVPLTRRLVPPTGEELRGAWVKRRDTLAQLEWMVLYVSPLGFGLHDADNPIPFDSPPWMSHGLRTDPADPTKWIPWAKEVWE